MNDISTGGIRYAALVNENFEIVALIADLLDDVTAADILPTRRRTSKRGILS